MARRRFRTNQRYEPSTERSFQEYALSTSLQQTSRTELLRLIRGGEDTFLELKVKLSNSERISQEIVALANTKGGTIIFGVNDQLRVEGVDDAEEVQKELMRICREEIFPPLVPYIDKIAFDSGRRIVAVDIYGKRRPYRTRDGRLYVRVGAEKREATPSELSELIDEVRPISYENLPSIGATLSDIDEAHLWSFVRAFEGDAFSEASMTGTGYSMDDILERHLLLATNTANEVTPTTAGLLLFGRDARVKELVPRSSVAVTRFSGDSIQGPIVETRTLGGNLFTLYAEALRFIKRYCDLWEVKPRSMERGRGPAGAPVPARANYHLGSLAEGLANMLTHRDLALRDTSTRIQIFDRSIEIINPRRIAGFAPATLKAIRYGIPQRLNPQITAIFVNPAYGIGLSARSLPVLLRETRLFSGRSTELSASNDSFRIRLYGA